MGWSNVCFDRRRSVPINQVEHVIVGKDYFTGEPSERYTNCANPACHKLMLCEEKHEAFYMRSCSDDCRRAERNFSWRKTVGQRNRLKNKLLRLQRSNNQIVNPFHNLIQVRIAVGFLLKTSA